MGTKITYKSLGHDPKEDYKWVTKALEKDGKNLAHSKKELKKLLKDPNIAFMQLGKKDIYAVNKLKYKKEHFPLLEANPVTFYYSLAYDVLPQMEEARILLLDSLKKEKSQYKWDTSVVYSYVFKVGAVGIIFSFLSLEAFMNQCLPDYANVEFEGKIANKNIIQKHLSFDDKFKLIIPKVTGKNFIEEHPKKVQTLLNLKKLRDGLTHLKEMRQETISAYDDIYNHILNIDIKRIINTVKFYINYHKPKTLINYRNKNKNMAKIKSKEVGEDEKGKYIKYYYDEFQEMTKK